LPRNGCRVNYAPSTFCFLVSHNQVIDLAPNSELRTLSDCRLCESTNIRDLFSLAPTPPGDIFFSDSDDAASACKYPLRLSICLDCSYVFLKDALDPQISYSNYVYESKVTVGLEERFRDLVNEIDLATQPVDQSTVVDLGCNDGTLLECFLAKGMQPIGVEPSTSLSNLAKQKGFPIFNEFFSKETSRKIIDRYGRASIITASYMFANIDDLRSFTDQVMELMANNGVFVVQTGYHAEQFQNLHFDYVYHEHFSYFSLTTLERLLAQSGFEIFDAKINSAKGGTITTFSQKISGPNKIKDSVSHIKCSEQSNGILAPEWYIDFYKHVEQGQQELKKLLANISRSGEKIVGYGASHSTTTFLHFLDIGKFLDYIVDDNERKHGLYSPGYGLNVRPSVTLEHDLPEYVVVLAWQHQDTIIKRSQPLIDRGLRFIIPFPELKIIGDDPHFF